jgi:multidrug efflux pump subunit AcrB
LLKTRNNSGGTVPLGSVATVQEVNGADQITRYNMFPAADLSGQPAPGASTGDALAAVEHLSKQILPTSFTTEWTEIALQQKLAGNSAAYIFPLCVLFVFLLLAALYESWLLPLAIILIVPMCLFSSIYGVWLRSRGAHTKRKFKYGKERSPRGLECECTQKERSTSITKQLVFQYPFCRETSCNRVLERFLLVE